MKKSLSTFGNNSLDHFFGSDFDRLFDNFLGRQGVQNNTNAVAFHPRVDIEESDDFFLVSADLPGMKSEDVKIEVKDGVLSFSGSREQTDREERKEDNYYRFERSWGKFSRSFQLPQNTNEEKIEARFENGVLEVMIPKVGKPESKTIKVESGKTGLFSKLVGSREDDQH